MDKVQGAPGPLSGNGIATLRRLRMRTPLPTRKIKTMLMLMEISKWGGFGSQTSTAVMTRQTLYSCTGTIIEGRHAQGLFVLLCATVAVSRMVTELRSLLYDCCNNVPNHNYSIFLIFSYTQNLCISGENGSRDRLRGGTIYM